MISQNFSPLSKKWPELYGHACKAEQYIYSDPHAATIKLRCYAELLVRALHSKMSLYSVGADNFYERLTDERFKQTVPNDILAKLHGIRIWGNKAAHGEAPPATAAAILLKDAYLLGKWFYRTIEKDESHYPDFLLPEHESSANNKNNAVEKLTSQLEQALAELACLQSQEQNVSSFTKEELNEYRLREFAQESLRVAKQIGMEPESTAKLFNLRDAFEKYELSPGQGALVEKLDAFLKNKIENVFLLQGYAGTGKTFITNGLTEYFRMVGRNYVLAAPTGKASKVLATKAASSAYTIHKTIYSFENIKEFKQIDVDGSETYKFYAELAVNTHPVDTVYIVDEASMVSNKHQEGEFFRFGSGYLLEDFFKFVNLDHNDHRKKVIFIGDNAQLPPVGMNFSPALDESYLRKKYNVKTISHVLDEVVRQKSDSGIIKNATMLRNSIDSHCFNQLVMNNDFPDVQAIEYEDIVENYFDACDRKLNNNAILIAYSNADVAAYNQAIRKCFLPGCGEDIFPGDKIMANTNNRFYGFFISNGDFGIVRKVLGNPEVRNVTLRKKNPETKLVEEIGVEIRFRNVELGFRDEDGLSRFFNAIIVENLLYSKQADLSSDENKALYVDFCIRHPGLKPGSQEFKDTLKRDPYFNAMRVKFGYAITCHKAQGSEWRHVFVKCQGTNARLGADYFRWLYTAITRASGQLYLVDPPSFKLGAGLKSVGLAPFSMPKPQTTVPVSTPASEEKASPSNAFPTVAPEASIRPPLDETFGLAETAPFLLNLLYKVRECILGTDIRIADIAHNQYQEAYFFTCNDETVRINIAYNAKENVRSIIAPATSGLSLRLIELLTPLKNVPLTAIPAGTAEFIFAEPFLRDYYETLVDVISEQNISVQNVEAIQYGQRYTFMRGNDLAKLDIWYNSKKQFKKLAPVMNFSSHPGLLHDITRLLTNIG